MKQYIESKQVEHKYSFMKDSRSLTDFFMLLCFLYIQSLVHTSKIEKDGKQIKLYQI